MKRQLLALITLLFLCPGGALAQTLKGAIELKDKTLSAQDFSLVAQTKAGKIQSASINSSGKFSLQKSSTKDRLFLLYKSNLFSPVILGVARSKTVKSYDKAVKAGLCSAGSARVVLTTKSGLKGTFKIVVDTDAGVAYGKSVKKGQIKDLLKGSTAEASVNCLPPGIESLSSATISGSGIGSIHRLSKAGVAAAAGDTDSDGVENETDIDDDDDGLSDAFDPDNDDDGIIDDSDQDNNDRNAVSQLFYFQQLHLDRENSYHPKLQTVSKEQIDNALKQFGGLALEVKAGSSVELNCGGDEASGGVGLPWCSAGGTGRAREPYPDGVEFPEGSDADGDGRGEITAGQSGDFQLAPGAASDQIRPGDTFIEEVTDDSDVVTKYVGVLNSVVLSVPGIVQVVTDLSTNVFDYPPTSTSIGTNDNPILVPSTGDVSITVTLYPPVYNTSAGEVVPGNLAIGLQIPSGPCTYDPVTKNCSGGGSGPGLLPGALFSNPSAGWSVASDGIRSSELDRSLDALQSVTFTVNLTGTGGVTGWDSGEHLKVPFQAFDNNGTTAVHNVIFKRQ